MPAPTGSWRGVLWSVLVAIGFFQLTHPRAMLPSFTMSMWWLAALCALVALVDIRHLRLPRPPWTVLAFCAVCSASMLWSIGPSDTARALGLYGWIILFACLVVANTTTAVLLRGIVWGALLVVASTLWALWLEHSGGTVPAAITPMAGFHGNRNVVSYSLVLGLSALLSRPVGRSWGLARWGISFIAIAGVIVLTGSGTGIVAGLVLVAAAAALSVARRWDVFGSVKSKMIGCAAVGAIALGSLAALEPLTSALGRRADLSGRQPLWEAILDVSGESPLGGYGLGAVWSYSWFSASWNSVKDTIDQSVGWFPHGHSLFFDLLPQVGVVGVVVAAIVLSAAGSRVFFPVPDASYDSARWGLFAVLGVFMCGLTEPMFAIPVGIFVAVTAAGVTRSFPRAVLKGRSL